jgi:hypothetical protein
MEEGSRSCTGDVRLTKRPPVLQPRSKETSRKKDLRGKTGRVRRPAGRLEGFEAMKNRLEGVQHLLVLGSAVAGPDGGGASLGDVDQSRRGDDGGGRGAAMSWARTAAALISARSTSVDWDYGGGQP